MILAFMTKFPKEVKDFGKEPTFFVEKIIKGLFVEKIITKSERLELMADASLKGFYDSEYNGLIIKHHTIRKKGRWKQGIMIDFFINARTPDMFRFAPRLECKSTQDIQIIWSKEHETLVTVKIDGKLFYTGSYLSNINKKMNELAMKDGFQRSEDFFLYFNTDFHGDLIHWTNKKY